MLCGIALALSAASQLPGQTVDASILGSVRDTTSAGLANVAVTAKNVATGVEWTVATTSTGRFALLQLPLGGPYTLTVRRLGFRGERRSGYQLALGTRVVVDIVLKAAPNELTPVIICGSSDERHSSNMGANYRVTGEQLIAVPAVNRNFSDLASLAPTTGVQSSLLGQRWTSTDLRIDGAQARNRCAPASLALDLSRSQSKQSASSK